MPKEEMRESLRPRIDAARTELALYAPDELVRRGGLSFREGGLDLSLIGTPYRIDLPDLVAHFVDGTICPEELQILFLDYLVHGDGSPITGQWIGFQELPDGMFYRRAFQGYSGDQLIRDFAGNIGSFRAAAADLDGTLFEMGDAAFAFEALPRVLLAVVWWAGDDEFPANATVLFDSASSRYLPTDGLAIVGRMLCRKLAKLAGAS
ncbi:MAG: DUF3786 domain-containing protein [Hyphomicrobiaceae bacterium]|nr:DUF3786 domain-containing protein [Hyphomicrobiaceae bacterium]